MASPPDSSRIAAKPLGDEIERVVPGRPAGTAPAPLAPVRTAGKQQPIVAVDALVEAPHLGADVAAGDRVGGAAVDAW